MSTSKASGESKGLVRSNTVLSTYKSTSAYGGGTNSNKRFVFQVTDENSHSQCNISNSLRTPSITIPYGDESNISKSGITAPPMLQRSKTIQGPTRSSMMSHEKNISSSTSLWSQLKGDRNPLKSLGNIVLSKV